MKKLIKTQVAELLREQKHEIACRTMAKYEATQPYPRGIGINWANYNPERDLQILDWIFNSSPRILEKYDHEVNGLRLPAAMMLLFGIGRASEWLPVGFQIRGKEILRQECCYFSQSSSMKYKN